METLEALQERTGTGKLGGIRLSDNFMRVVKRPFPSDGIPAGHRSVEYVDTELPSNVTIRDLGVTRRSVYRDLGRGAIPMPAGGRQRRPTFTGEGEIKGT